MMDTNYYSGYVLSDNIHHWELTEKQTMMLDCVLFLVDNRCTLRCAALNCCVSKSSLHYWIHGKLPSISHELYGVVVKILRYNETKKIGGVNFGKHRIKK